MEAVKHFIKKHFSRLLYKRKTNAARRLELEQHTAAMRKQQPASIADASFDIFTYHGEDGILHYLLSFLPDAPRRFVDVGSGDCIKSNCAMLAVQLGWEGVFIDKNKRQLAVGRHFYGSLSTANKLSFTEAAVTPATINQLATSRQAGVLSIDIDGNDYWIWKALDAIQPEVVIIEAKVEFGQRNCVVPEGPGNHHAVDPMYNGASVEALTRLGRSKGYKLAGANKQGYNLFFVKQHHPLPEVSAASVLNDPDTVSSFYPDTFFHTHTFTEA
ncbi:MAG: hypothetical protein JNM88_13610 [Chitinophagaceae bacterium]|nr:hypothetical protein [Chitinophagaceae bacterium]